jgi:hypothetical protein
MAAGGARVRVFLITIPGIRGNAWVAFNIQALLSSARLLAGAKSATEAAIKIMTRIEPPCTSRTRTRMLCLVEGYPRICISAIRRSDRTHAPQQTASPIARHEDAKSPLIWITSSARPSIVAGISTRVPLRVFRWISTWNLVGNQTGKPAGSAPHLPQSSVDKNAVFAKLLHVER